MDRLVLHEYAASGNCYKIRLTASLLGMPIERRQYDILKGETRTPEFLVGINANGRIPVLQITKYRNPESPAREHIPLLDVGPYESIRFLPESNAACWYLAEGSALIPEDRFARADMLRWMFFEQYNHEPNVATLRFWLAFVGEANLNDSQRNQIAAKRTAGDAALRLMDGHLSCRDWLVGEQASLADIALYAYTHVAEEGGGFRLAGYPHVVRWLDRVAALPGYCAITD